MDSILLVDDSEESRQLLAAILGREGFSLREAGDGEAAVNICREEPPDLILLDIVMPRKDGYETCRELKADKHTGTIPIIFLSAKDDASDKVKGLDLGAVDYITKPFDRAEVVARVRTQLEIHNLTRELFESNRQLQEKQARIEEDLKAAAEIQAALIPSAKPELPQFSFSWKFIPSDQSGGDIFNIHQLDERNVAIYLADVSGHGVPAAMVTVSVVQSLQPHGGTILDGNGEDGCGLSPRKPSEVLEILNREYPIERFDKYFTMVYMLIDRFSGEIAYSNAGHPSPLLIRASGEVESLDEGGPLIGIDGPMPFEDGKKRLQKGDRLYFYTDGITEFGGDDDFFGVERLEAGLVATRYLSLDEACDKIIETVISHGRGMKADDDITLVALEFDGDA